MSNLVNNMFTPGARGPAASASASAETASEGAAGGAGAGNLPMGGFDSIFQSYVIVIRI